MGNNKILNIIITLLIIAAVIFFLIYFYNRSRAQQQAVQPTIFPSQSPTATGTPSLLSPTPSISFTPETGGS